MLVSNKILSGRKYRLGSSPTVSNYCLTYLASRFRFSKIIIILFFFPRVENLVICQEYGYPEVNDINTPILSSAAA